MIKNFDEFNKVNEKFYKHGYGGGKSHAGLNLELKSVAKKIYSEIKKLGADVSWYSDTASWDSKKDLPDVAVILNKNQINVEGGIKYFDKIKTMFPDFDYKKGNNGFVVKILK